MEVQIKTKPAFSVLGIEGCGNANEGPQWITPLWNQAFNRFSEIRHLVKSDHGAWGLMSATDEFLAIWKEQGKYLAGWEIKAGTKPPEGWTVWDIPAQRYAVIACTIETYGDAFMFVVQQFLPKKGYERAGAMHEFYPKEFQDTEKGTLYLWFPIKKA